MGDNRKTRQLKEKMMLNIVKRLEDRIAFATPTMEPEEGSNEQGEDAKILLPSRMICLLKMLANGGYDKAKSRLVGGGA